MSAPPFPEGCGTYVRLTGCCAGDLLRLQLGVGTTGDLEVLELCSAACKE